MKAYPLLKVMVRRFTVTKIVVIRTGRNSRYYAVEDMTTASYYRMIAVLACMSLTTAEFDDDHITIEYRPSIR